MHSKGTPKMNCKSNSFIYSLLLSRKKKIEKLHSCPPKAFFSNEPLFSFPERPTTAEMAAAIQQQIILENCFRKKEISFREHINFKYLTKCFTTVRTYQHAVFVSYFIPSSLPQKFYLLLEVLYQKKKKRERANNFLLESWFMSFRCYFFSLSFQFPHTKEGVQLQLRKLTDIFCVIMN